MMGAQFALWLYWRNRWNNVTWTSLLVVAILNAQYLLVEFDLGGFSLRLYTAVAGIVFCLLPRVDIFFRRLGVSGTVLLVIAVFEAAWRLLLAIKWGVTAEGGGVSEWASYWGIPLAFFCIIVAGITNEQDLRVVVRFMALHLLANSVFAVLQWQNVDWAWSISEAQRPISAGRRFEAMTLDQGSFGYAPGLQAFSIPMSYLSVIGFVVFAVYAVRAMEQRRVRFAGRMMLFAALCFGGSLAALSRSSCYISAFALVVILWRSRLHATYRVAVITIATVGTIGGLIAFAGADSSDGGRPGWDANRLKSVSDMARVEIWTTVLEKVIDHPVIPAAAQGESERLETSPHNQVLNALYYGGVMSGVFQLAIMASLALLVGRSFVLSSHAANERDYEAKTGLIALCWASVAYVLKGQVHNDSFATGGTMGWFVAALLIVSLNNLGGAPRGRPAAVPRGAARGRRDPRYA